jgi:hypothetical protein
VHRRARDEPDHHRIDEDREQAERRLREQHRREPEERHEPADDHVRVQVPRGSASDGDNHLDRRRLLDLLDRARELLARLVIEESCAHRALRYTSL